MKIINWNVGRPTQPKGERILRKLKELNGDIVILTETNARINLSRDYTLISTLSLPKDLEGKATTYKEGENRSSIWSKYPVSNTYPTYDPYTSLCADIQTPFGMLRVYATIIGVFGGRGDRFKEDLKGQLSDFDKLFLGKQVCLVGDYNTTFHGYAYPNPDTRKELAKLLEQHNLTNLTSIIADSVDHIAISNNFLHDTEKCISFWNLDKRISDHIGVSVTIEKANLVKLA